MAIQMQMYSDNLGLYFAAGGGSSQDYCFMDNIFNLQQKQLQQQEQQLQQLRQQQEQQCLVQFQNLQNPSVGCYNGFVTNATTTTTTASCTTASVDRKPPMFFSHEFAGHLDKHTQEMDQYIALQDERLKVALQEQTKKQMGEIYMKVQAKGMMIMQQKKQEIAKAREKQRVLEESLIKIEAEKQAWKRMAVENESMVISLNNTLEQVKEQNADGYLNNKSSDGVDDAESCCDSNGNIYKNERKSEEIRMEMKCKVCKKGEASVVLLPCRHLCCCIACHSSIDACPLCGSLKKASIQALFS